jgi:hypothetical protein
MDPDQEDNLELIPAHHRQDALQEARDEKTGNLSALVPRGAGAFLLCARSIAG